MIAIGSGDLQGFSNKTFPWLDSPVQDNEKANDDFGGADEQSVPKNGHLYSWDAPAYPIGEGTEHFAFLIARATFKEWVRVQVNNTPFPAFQDVVCGSRASHKYNWHLLFYGKRDSSGKWVLDNDNPSYNTPVFTGTGNGTIAVTLLEDAVTEGFTATYDEANLKWTLDGTSSVPVHDEKESAPQGTQWTLTVTDKITVVITQGATPFADGEEPEDPDAEFNFSVFKSTATGGKTNEIDEGYIDVTDGP